MAGKSDKRTTRLENTYWAFSQRPLQSLVFLLPIIVAYELALPILGTDHIRQVSVDITARRQLNEFFEWFGVTGYYLPGLIILVVLLCWHVARKDPWRIDPKFCLYMGMESAVLAVPLFVFMLVITRQQPVSASMLTLAAGEHANTWQAELLFSIGAGIYEELLFRLVAIALVHMVLVDLLALPEHIGAIGSVALSAVAFSLYHFESLASVEVTRFLFYTAAGVYFAGIYVLRGFGVVVVTHAVYDVMIVLQKIQEGTL